MIRKQGQRVRLLGLAAGFACAVTALLASPALATTETFNYNGTNGTDGSAQFWTVPTGVTSASFDLFGAAGGVGIAGEPGLGGRATATLPLTPGAAIRVNVGGQGQPNPVGAGGFNGGGTGDLLGPGGFTGGGGGGASDIRIGGTALGQRVLVAGGGGGSGNCDGAPPSDGGDGGGLEGAGGNTSCSGTGPGGGGGTQDEGGSATSPATEGSFGAGGNGAGGPVDPAAGGGGGGWYGGGGGLKAGGGGGGSGHGPAGTNFETGVRSGNGQVTITYTANPTAANPTAAAGKDPKCNKLRKKLKRQKKNLAKAGSEEKQAMVRANIEETKKRLKKLGC